MKYNPESKMDSNFLGLPPLKRLRLMQLQQELQKLKQQASHEETAIGCSPLPAKKRKESRDSIFLHDPSVSASATAYSLPAKKRVWALQPDFASNIDVLPFDLNVEYNPSIEDEEKGVGEKESSNEISLVVDCASQSIKNVEYEKEEDGGAVVLSNFVNESAETSHDEEEEDKCAVEVEAAEFVNEPVENSQYETEDRVAVVPVDCVNESVEISRDQNEGSSGAEVADCIKVSIENAKDKNEKVRVAVVDCVSESVEIAKNGKEDIGDVVADYANQFIETGQDQKGANKGEDFVGPSEEDDDGILCAVCLSTDGDPADPIVMCDGCDLMVHATCYGNPLVKGIPEGDWFCEQCLVLSCQNEKEKKGVSCCLCPVKNGALKPTTDKRWAHIVCALLVPEVFFGDPEGREGIDCSKVPERRWLEKCYICKSSNGCCILCSEPKCPLAFHVTCGLKEDLSIEYKEGKKSATIVAGFCKLHTEMWRKLQQSGKYKIVAREEKRKPDRYR